MARISNWITVNEFGIELEHQNIELAGLVTAHTVQGLPVPKDLDDVGDICMYIYIYIYVCIHKHVHMYIISHDSILYHIEHLL